MPNWTFARQHPATLLGAGIAVRARQRGRQTRLKPVLEQLGYRFLPRPNDNFAIAGLAGDIVIKDHYWHCLDTGQAGNAIDFLKVRRSLGEGGFVKIRGVTFSEAMTLLTSATPPAES